MNPSRSTIRFLFNHSNIQKHCNISTITSNGRRCNLPTTTLNSTSIFDNRISTSTSFSNQRYFSNSSKKSFSHSNSSYKVSVGSDGSDSDPSTIGKVTPKLSLTFTCTVPDCGTRSTHEFTKQAYTKGIVLVQCPGCKNRHLIADHLGWFKDSNEPRTVEEIVKAHGGRVRRGVALSDGIGGETLEIEDGQVEEIGFDGKKAREEI